MRASRHGEIMSVQFEQGLLPTKHAPGATQRAKIACRGRWRTCARVGLRGKVVDRMSAIQQRGRNMRWKPIAAVILGYGVLVAHAFAEGEPGPCPANPNALGVARTVEVDTTGGPGFGFEQYKAHDFLVQKEVVLTFDDGPWPNTTRAVLDALAQHCVKATFFPIGKHALWHPEILKEVAAAGHSIGGHTWSHANLGKAKGEKAIEEIEKGFSAVKLALGAPSSPFFRFPFLQDPKDLVAYLGSRNVAIFSHDLDSF